MLSSNDEVLWGAWIIVAKELLNCLASLGHCFYGSGERAFKFNFEEEIDGIGVNKPEAIPQCQTPRNRGSSASIWPNTAQSRTYTTLPLAYSSPYSVSLESHLPRRPTPATSRRSCNSTVSCRQAHVITRHSVFLSTM